MQQESENVNALDTAAEALAKLKIHEEALGRLYTAYAQRLPEQSGFWSELSREEYQHARWIEMLETHVGNDPAGFVARQFPLAAIEHSLVFVEKLIVKAEGPDLTPIKAISAALNLEQGLLENKYFEVFETDGAEMKRLLALLQDKAEAHYEVVRKAWEDMREGGRGPA